MEQTVHSPQSATDAPLKSEVDDFLRRKRKVREHKACYPCRSRKVKCDLGRPCRTCTEREHPELCDYHPPAKRQNVNATGPVAGSADGLLSAFPASETVTLSQAEFAHLCRKLESVEANLDDLRKELRGGLDTHVTEDTRSPIPILTERSQLDGGSRHDLPISTSALPPFHTRNDLTGQTVHLGGSSVPALVVALGQGNREQANIQDILGKSILPLFGLDNETATYPFVDLWGLAHGWVAKAEQLAKTIPSDNQCLSFFHYYRDMGHVIYPGVADIAGFERDLTSFLNTRTKFSDFEVKSPKDPPPGVTEQSLYERDLNWIGLLFAVLASGCQSSNLARKERELTSQVYMCCSLESLRFTNFLSVPTVESVQALLVLGNVISNNMNAGTSWNLIGLTARLAQSLGLHQPCPADMPSHIKSHRAKIWWTLMWQDSLLSITYDRASFTALVDHSDMANPFYHVGMPAFHSAMLRICKVGLDVVRDRTKVMSSREQFIRMTRGKEEIATVLRETAEHLRELNNCRTLRDSVEHWSLYLHVSYVTSELCRPAISPSGVDPEVSKHFRQTCLDSLVNTVDAWLGLQNVTTYARHSWASIHRALSSALLLGIMGEHQNNEHCRKLLKRFIGLMDDMTSSVEPQELAAPVTRAITALRKLKIHQLPTHVTSTSKNGTRLNPPQQPQHHSHGMPPMHQSLGPTHGSSGMNQPPPPRFIEDIALGGPSPRTDTSSPSARPGEPVNGSSSGGSWYGNNAATPITSTHSSVDEQSPYTVRDTILWGNSVVPHGPGVGMGGRVG